MGNWLLLKSSLNHSWYVILLRAEDTKSILWWSFETLLYFLWFYSHSWDSWLSFSLHLHNIIEMDIFIVVLKLLELLIQYWVSNTSFNKNNCYLRFGVAFLFELKNSFCQLKSNLSLRTLCQNKNIFKLSFQDYFSE